MTDTSADHGNDPTLDPALASWVPVPDGSDFPIQNLPYGVFTRPGIMPHLGVAIGDHVLDVAALQASGKLEGIGVPARAVFTHSLNALMSLDPQMLTELRQRLSELLRSDGELAGPEGERYLLPADEVTMLLPVEIGDYVDFYSSIHHASNVGRMFRPDAEPLLPNWRHLPVGYHGRSGTVVVSGTPITRPIGQRRGADGPTFGPSEKLDFELEVGFLTGQSVAPGRPLPVGGAERHIFGMCLVNDWSARDIQAWEYVPLGPFLGKSFATTMSPWVVTMAALAPFRISPPVQEPEPFPYLRTTGDTAVDLRLEVDIDDTTVTRVGFSDMYWTMAQQLAHATVNGAGSRTGDLFASGTVSGPEPGTLGSLLEATWNGQRPFTLDDGSMRTFLADGDTVTLRGWCEADGATRIGFGECTGAVQPAVDSPT